MFKSYFRMCAHIILGEYWRGAVQRNRWCTEAIKVKVGRTWKVIGIITSQQCQAWKWKGRNKLWTVALAPKTLFIGHSAGSWYDLITALCHHALSHSHKLSSSDLLWTILPWPLCGKSHQGPPAASVLILVVPSTTTQNLNDLSLNEKTTEVDSQHWPRAT